MNLRRTIVQVIKDNISTEKEKRLLNEFLESLRQFFEGFDNFLGTNLEDIFYYVYLEDIYYTYIEISLHIGGEDASSICRKVLKIDKYICEIIRVNPKYKLFCIYLNKR